MPSPDGLQKKSTDVMTLPELNKTFGKVAKDMTGRFQEEMMVKIGMEAKRMIFERVHDTGIDAKGNKYAPYSTKNTLAGSSTFAFKKGADRFFSNKKLEWRTVKGRHLAILPGGYAKIRELQDRQTGFVDFSVTNRMWKDINIIQSTITTVTLGAKEELNKAKLAGNTKRRTDILDLNQKEIDELKKTYGLSVLNIFKENGL